MEPITREELFWAKVIGETVPDIEPVVRKEMFLARIAGMDIPAIEPITREEMFLNAIANKKMIDLEPITRREMFLAKAMGADVTTPEPFSRIEFFLSQVKSNESGGSPEEPEPEEPESNAIFTADFEDGTTDGWENLWGVVKTVEAIPEAAYSGNYGLHVEYNGSWQHCRTFIETEPGKTYKLTAMGKIVSGPALVILIKDGHDRYTLASKAVNSSDWESLSVTFEATEESTIISIMSETGGSSAYIDDIVVTEI